MARQQGSKLGDRVRIKDRDFAIGGLTRGTFSMANPLILAARPCAAGNAEYFSVSLVLLSGPGHPNSRRNTAQAAA